MRTDSTVGATVICTLNRGEPVSVAGELYEWYRIRLPKDAPSYVKKTLVAPVDDKTAKVLKDKVNIRLSPGESSPILGKANKDDMLHVVGSEGEWFKVRPTARCSGWIHKQFVLPFRTGMAPKEKAPDSKPLPEEPAKEVTLEGIIEPYGKVVNRIATHKLIVREQVDCPDDRQQDCYQQKIFLLKGSRPNLNTLTYHKVKVTGMVTGKTEQKYPVIEISKVELLQ